MLIWMPTAVKRPIEWDSVIGISPNGHEVVVRRQGNIYFSLPAAIYVGWVPVFWRAITEEDGK